MSCSLELCPSKPETSQPCFAALLGMLSLPLQSPGQAVHVLPLVCCLQGSLLELDCQYGHLLLSSSANMSLAVCVLKQGSSMQDENRLPVP